jgi:hypothetical protein
MSNERRIISAFYVQDLRNKDPDVDTQFISQLRMRLDIDAQGRVDANGMSLIPPTVVKVIGFLLLRFVKSSLSSSSLLSL